MKHKKVNVSVAWRNIYCRWFVLFWRMGWLPMPPCLTGDFALEWCTSINVWCIFHSLHFTLNWLLLALYHLCACFSLLFLSIHGTEGMQFNFLACRIVSKERMHKFYHGFDLDGGIWFKLPIVSPHLMHSKVGKCSYSIHRSGKESNESHLSILVCFLIL